MATPAQNVVRIINEPMLNSFDLFYDSNINTCSLYDNVSSNIFTFYDAYSSPNVNVHYLYDAFNEVGQIVATIPPSGGVFSLSATLNWNTSANNQWLSIGWGDVQNRFSITLEANSPSTFKYSLNYQNCFGEQFRFVDGTSGSYPFTVGINTPIVLQKKADESILFKIGTTTLFNCDVVNTENKTPNLDTTSNNTDATLGKYYYIEEYEGFYQGIFSFAASVNTSYNNSVDPRCVLSNITINNFNYEPNPCIYNNACYMKSLTSDKLYSTGSVYALNYLNLPEATTSKSGIVRLVDSVTDTSTILAPTAKALKQTYDLALSASSQWITNGSNIYYNSNVGIGVSSPAAKLEVSGNIRSTGISCTGSVLSFPSYNVPEGSTSFTDVQNNMVYSFANSGGNGTGAAWIFDGNNSTVTFFGDYNSSGTYTGTQVTSNIGGAWFEIRSSVPFVVTSYSQKALNNYWKSWYLFGSQTGTLWTLIDSRTITSWTYGNNDTTFTVSHPDLTPYAYYRYVINKSVNAAPPCLVEYRLFGYVPVINASSKGVTCQSVTVQSLTTNTLTIPSSAITQQSTSFTDSMNNMTYTFTNQSLNGQNAAWLFDENANTVTYFDGYNATTGAYQGTATDTGSVKGAWFQVQSTTPFMLTSYTQRAANSAYWLTWYIFGSTNGTTWVLVDYRNISSWTYGNDTTTFTIPTPGNAFAYYRYVINKSAGNIAPCMNEFKLYGSIPTFNANPSGITCTNLSCLSLTVNGQQIPGSGSSSSSPWIINGQNIYFTNGAVGIGIANPSFKLHDAGSLFIGDITYASSTIPSTVASLETANGYRLVFDNTFNGTTGTGMAANKIVLHNNNWLAGFGIEGGTLPGVTYHSGAGHNFYINTNNSSYGSRAMSLNASGNLTVTGSISCSGGFYVNGQQITGGSGGSTQWGTIGNNIFFTNGSVGIGNNNPAYKFQVTGDVNIEGANSRMLFTTPGVNNSSSIRQTSADNYNLFIELSSDKTDDNVFTRSITLGSATTPYVAFRKLDTRFYGTIVTDYWISASEFFATSDKSFKSNITQVSSAQALMDICTLNGYHYTINKDESKHKIGLIAQEVEQLYPQLVHTNGDGIKSLDYNGIIPLLVESIKQLQSELEALRAKIV